MMKQKKEINEMLNKDNKKKIDKKTRETSVNTNKGHKKLVSKNVKKQNGEEQIIINRETKQTSDNTFSLLEVIGLLVSAIIITFIIGVVLGNNYGSRNIDSIDSTLSEIIDNYNVIKKQYPETSQDDLLNGAIKGMLGAVDDPYASFIESDSNLDLEIKGIYEGLGIEIITYDDGEIYVSSVFEDSSADAAGILVGDKLIQIDDLTLTDKTGSDFANYVRESQKTEFKVIVSRDGEQKEYLLEKTVTIIPSVFTDIIEQNDKKIGYLQITIFSEQTLKQYKQKLQQLEKQGIDSLILDLRGNSGGVLSTVSDILSTMLSSSNIIYQTDDDGKIDKFYSSGDKSKDYDIVVLVNKESASASEIMAASLRDNLKAKLVGETTYGKGTVQQVKQLSSGDEYKLTTKKWLTPKGECVDGVGLTPDYMVKLGDEYFNNPSMETDNQLQKAIEILK